MAPFLVETTKPVPNFDLEQLAPLRKQQEEDRKAQEALQRAQQAQVVYLASHPTEYAQSVVPAAQWPCLYQLWTNESGWRWWADNPYSDAYGIPQALPGSKMASFGADWATNPVTQINWGLDYIAGRYGTPCNALAFWYAHNWY